MELLKLLLVDDDMLSVAYMKENFDWHSYGFEVVGAAYNGRQALKQFAALSPDLIISDVSMPLMDGVSMAHEIRAMGQKTHIVLLTAYNEFEYVRGAIKADVDDYLIKDELTEPVLRECLEKIRARILRDHRSDDRTYQHALCDYMSAGADYVLRHYPEKAVGKYLAAEHFFWILTEGAPLIRTDAQGRETESSLSDAVQRALLEARKAESGTFRVFWADGCTIVAWDAEDGASPDGGTGRRAGAFLERLSGARPLLLLYSERRISLESVRRLIRQKGNPIRCARMLLGAGIARPLRCIPQVKPSMEAPELSGIVERLTACEGAASVERALRALLVDADRCCMPYERCVELLRAVDGRLRRQLVERAAPQGGAPCDLQALAAHFARMLERLKENRALRPEVRRALDYLNQHYGDPELRLSQVARHVGLSDSRFSVVFKEDTGRTMGQYLTDIRIRRAKQLLAEGELRVYEIASRVGCRNSQYFSTLFYKGTGMYPSQYKGE